MLNLSARSVTLHLYHSRKMVLVSPPKRISQRVIVELGYMVGVQQKSGLLSTSPLRLAVFAYCLCLFRVSEPSDGGQDTQDIGLGDRLYPAVDTELAVNVTGVNFDRVQGEEKSRCNLGVGQSFGDELEDFQLALAQRLN